MERRKLRDRRYGPDRREYSEGGKMIETIWQKKISWNWTAVFFWAAVVVIVTIAIFTITGIYQVGWGIDEKQSEIAELTRSRDAWKAQALDQDRYIQQQRKHIAELQAAMNFENLLVYAASPQGLIDMQQIENMLKNKAEFCLSGGKQALEPKKAR